MHRVIEQGGILSGLVGIIVHSRDVYSSQCHQTSCWRQIKKIINVATSNFEPEWQTLPPKAYYA